MVESRTTKEDVPFEPARFVKRKIVRLGEKFYDTSLGLQSSAADQLVGESIQVGGIRDADTFTHTQTHR